jgi:uncharacterized protein (DUF58 family)
MSRRPTGRGIIVTVVGAVIFLAAATTQAGWLFVMAVGALGAVLGSAFMPHRLKSIWVEREIPELATAGDLIDVTLTITNKGAKPTPPVRVEDLSCALPALCEGLEPGATGTATATRLAPRRGIFEGGRVNIKCGAPFGFVSTTRTVTVESPIVVVPRAVALDSLSFITGTSRGSADGLRMTAPSGEYVGVRDYRPGDSRRAVHWRTSARAGTLVVREFEDVAAPAVTLLIHAAEAGAPPKSQFEALVSAAASIACHLAEGGHPVHLVRSTPAGVEHLTGARSPQILRWLAGCEPVDGPLAPAVAGALARSERNACVVVLTATDRTPAEVTAACDDIAVSGRSPALVLAGSHTWTQGAARGGEHEVIAAARRTCPVRVLTREQELTECLRG